MRTRRTNNDEQPGEKFQLRHYFHRDRKGNLHIDTVIDGERWQHHVHSEDAFARWSELMAEGELIELPEHECACDLLPHQVLEHDGRIYWNDSESVSSRRGRLWKFLSFVNLKDREHVPQS